jgi:hypothetical protein
MMSVDAVWDTDLIQDAADSSLSDVKKKNQKNQFALSMICKFSF